MVHSLATNVTIPRWSISLMTAGGLREQVRLRGLDAGKNVTRAYGHLYAPGNTFTEYAGFDAAGGLLHEGQTGQDGYAIAWLNGAVAVAQYDPNAGRGVVSHATRGNWLGLVPFIQDREADNKLYFRSSGLEGSADPDAYTFDLELRTAFFEAASADWKAEAGAFVQSFAPGDLSEDGLTNQDDLDTVLGGWGQTVALAARPDAYADGVVSQPDLDVVLSDWGNGIPPASIPEPATLSLLTLGALAVMRRRRI